jgi:tRNA dimethylallyltransferase
VAPMKVDTSPRPVIAIFGPTASGKSAVAEAVAERIPAEIVSADSMQVYRGLPILTNQPQRPTRLAAVWELDHDASVGEYARLAHAAIDDALAGGRTPIVVGGTGLYLRAALADLQLPPAATPARREHFERLYDRVGPEQAHASLAELDPAAAQKVHPNDRRRVVRAFELAELGETLAPDSNRLWTEEMRRPTVIFGLEVSREVLSRRIELRTQAMFDMGVEEEVTRAVARAPSGTARQVIGLREVTRLPRAEAIAAVTLRTLQYAAYQRKWMRRIPGLIPLDAERSPDEVTRELLAVAAKRFTLSGQQEEGPTGIRKGEADHTGHAV